MHFKRILYFIVIVFVFDTLACSNEFTVNAPYIEKTVVTGLLDFGDDTNYLRIEKTFLLDYIDASIQATDPDNIYYLPDDLTVFIEQWKNGTLVTTLNAEYVDGDSLGLIKEPGTFAASPNILYRITEPIDSMSLYKLFVIKNQTGDTITASTNIVHDYYVYYPTRTGAYIDYSDTTQITYTCRQAENAILYELWLRLNYYEKNITTGDSALLHIDWQLFMNKVGDDLTGNGNITCSINRSTFFSFLAGALEQNDNVTRSVSSLNFFWYAGGDEMYQEYLNILANLGINEDYISPEYTNIEGGLGIFSSRHKQSVFNVHPTDATLDSISCGSITNFLNFKSSLTNPYYPGCE